MIKGIAFGFTLSIIAIILSWLWSAASLSIPKGGGVAWDIRSFIPVAVRFFAGMLIGVSVVAISAVAGLYAIRSYLYHVAPKVG